MEASIGLPVGFQWSVKIYWKMAVVGVFWPLPFVPASGPLRILNALQWT